MNYVIMLRSIVVACGIVLPCFTSAMHGRRGPRRPSDYTPHVDPYDPRGPRRPSDYTPHVDPYDPRGPRRPSDYTPHVAPYDPRGPRRPSDYTPHVDPYDPRGPRRPSDYIRSSVQDGSERSARRLNKASDDEAPVSHARSSSRTTAGRSLSTYDDSTRTFAAYASGNVGAAEAADVERVVRGGGYDVLAAVERAELASGNFEEARAIALLRAAYNQP